MCRLLAIVSSEPTRFELCLRSAPRSLAALSREHPHGWGMAVFGALPSGERVADWEVHRDVQMADIDENYHRLAGEVRGQVLVAHVRQRTVGALLPENTHPFRVGRWVFAHNGTVNDLERLRASVTPSRLARVAGTTDSELLFASLLGELDRQGLAEQPAGPEVDHVVRTWIRGVRAWPNSGALNFVLSDGDVTYAHRWLRTMYCLARATDDPVRSERSEGGLTVCTGWSSARTALLIASERLTDEPWNEMPEGCLWRINRHPLPNVVELLTGP